MGKVKNICWRGDGEMPHTVSAGMDEPVVLDLSTSAGRAGFYHPLAGRLIAADDGFKVWAGKARDDNETESKREVFPL